MALPVIVAVQIVTSAQPISSREAFRILEAIHQVENPDNVETPGAHGELGPFQMTLDTWRMHTLLPFTPQYACDPQLAQSVALKHLRGIEREFAKRGIYPGAYNFAIAWNAGVHAAAGGIHVPTETFLYAQRVENIYKTIR